MLFYLFYQLGYVGALLLPRPLCRWVALRIADVYCLCAVGDRRSVYKNLETILGQGKVSPFHVRQVFQNFGLYLVDFLRFSHLTPENAGRFVRLEGFKNIKQALSEGKGVIGLSAHLGNYELAGAILSFQGLSVYAAVLTHRNPQVDSFFTRQRRHVGVEGIPIGERSRKAFFEKALSVLEQNGVLALVGDRDFTDHGVDLPLFGKSLRMPTGPAALSLRSGAPIVPGFLIREEDGSYRFTLETPIRVPEGVPRQEAIRLMTKECLDVMVRYIRKYPTQWYMFQEFWKPAPTFIR